MKNGVPYDVAFCLTPGELLAHVIAFAEMDGQKFNWSTMRFEKPK